jgi:hypothetical protein
MGWQNRFDRLLKAMSEGEPHKVTARKSASVGRASSMPITECLLPF